LGLNNYTHITPIIKIGKSLFGIGHKKTPSRNTWSFKFYRK
jgi:hypothetical protein